ncbi:PAS domain S-box-containing protein [Alkalispirochaeta americana]|uniref:histidine kinase n=1 Tax=Alkalispirochaeta americana TaxID=159291 RepID=A0A1N6Q8P1_9SPIO|nr:PAS domain S-box protein [Alkalispirochaeta americana]SIQ12875.1 PAS domain S-box-containing protein [Alkalispirochaeta americana]
MEPFNNPAFFYQLFQGISEAAAVLDGQDRIITVNRRFESFYGYHRDAITGRYINDLIVPDAQAREAEAYSRIVLSGTPLSVNAIRRHADGTPLEVSISAQPIFLEGKQEALFVMYRDITDQVILLDSIDIHIWYLARPDTYGAVNDAHARFLGRSKGEIQHQPIEQPLFREGNREVFSSGTETTEERWAERADGARRLLKITKKPRFDREGRIKYVVCTARDTTEERDQENSLRLLSSMVERSADPMVRTDVNHRITYMNPAAETHFGWTTREVAGKSPAIFNAEEQAEAIQQEILETIKSGQTYQGRLRNRRKDGSTFMAHIKISPITDRQGEIIGFVDIQRDISADQEELETRDLLLKEVQHRVKNNLATVVSLLSLQATQQDDSSVTGALEDARRRIEAVLTVYESLHQNPSTETVHLPSYLEQIIQKLKESFASPLSFCFRWDEQDVIVDSSTAIALGMIVNELLTNAVKHAFPRQNQNNHTGAVEVSLETPPPGTRHLLRVSNNGDPLPDHLEPGGPGCGLGLTLVHSLAQKVRGVLSIHREEETSFSVAFPAQPPGTSQAPLRQGRS